MNKYGRVMGVAAMTAALVAVGCSKSTPADPKPSGSNAGNNAPKTSYVIGVVAKSQGNPVFQAARVGAEQAAKDLSEKYDIDVSIRWQTPDAEDAQVQAQFVEQLVTAGVDGIAISVIDANLLTPVLKDATNKGAIVMTFDSDAPASGRMAYYGVDDKAAGAAVMRELAGVMGPDGGKVAILAGNQAAGNLQARVAGVREEAATHANISIADVYYHPETANDAAAKMQEVQNANPDIKGWALVGGWPLYTKNALDGVYETAKVVSLDPLPLPLDYLKKGQVQVLIGQPYFGWGYESVTYIVEKLYNNQSPADEFIYASFDVVTEDNVDEYLANWKAWQGD